MKTDSIVCITLYAGQQVMGKFKSILKDELTQEVMITIEKPRALILNQQKPNAIGLGPIIGDPFELSFKNKDTMLFNTVDDGNLLNAYYQATTSLVTAPLMFDAKKRGN